MDGVARWITTGEEDCEYRCVQTLEHWLVPEALRFWDHRPADGIMIGRDVPSRAIARLLNSIILYEPIDDHRDFRVRLAGSALVRRFAHDVTGRKMSELFGPAAFRARFQVVMEVLKTATPRMVRVSHEDGGCGVPRLELLIVPVIAPNGCDRWALAFCFNF